MSPTRTVNRSTRLFGGLPNCIKNIFDTFGRDVIRIR